MSFGGSTDVKETDLQKEEARIAREKFNYLRTERNAATETLIDKAKQMNDDSNYETLSQESGAIVGQTFDDAKDNVVSSMARNGVDPTSGKFIGTLQALGEDEGTTASEVKNRAGVAQQDRYTAALSGVIAQGEGKSADAVSNLSDLASNSTRVAQANADAALRSYDRKVGGVSTLAGIGYEATREDDG